MRYVQFDPNGGCWLWDSGVTWNGWLHYPIFTLRPGRQQRVSRFMYEHFNGPMVPDAYATPGTALPPWPIIPAPHGTLAERIAGATGQLGDAGGLVSAGPLDQEPRIRRVGLQEPYDHYRPAPPLSLWARVWRWLRG